MNIFDFIFKLKGYPISEARKTYSEIKGISVNEFENYIYKAKHSIVNFHRSNNLFYKKINLNDNWKWEDLPVLYKKDFQIPLDYRLSEGVHRIYTSKTSGSTGNPFYYAKDKFCHSLTWMKIEDCFAQHSLFGSKQARFYGIPNTNYGRVVNWIKDVALNRYTFDVFDLSEKSLASWVEVFKKSKFSYINGYTTVIVAFAKYLKSKNIILKDVCPTLKKVVVTSEMCFDEDRLLMEEVFSVKVINEYGASELDLIAFENTNNEWQINTETLFVEILDEENKELPDGEIGRIVITSLYNKANSFIRYDIGDRGSINRINSKKVILLALEGRKEDIVLLPNGKKAPGLTIYYITKSLMQKNHFVKELKVTQLEIDEFQVEYVANRDLTQKEIKDVNQAFSDYFKCSLSLRFNRVVLMTRQKSGKLKQFTSLIK